MKTTVFALLALLTVVISAALPQKAVIVSYPDETPNHVVDKAMGAIVAAGGKITHEYKLIKGFAAKAPAGILDTIQIWGNDFHAVIEEDQIVTALPNPSW